MGPDQSYVIVGRCKEPGQVHRQEALVRQRTTEGGPEPAAVLVGVREGWV